MSDYNVEAVLSADTSKFAKGFKESENALNS